MAHAQKPDFVFRRNGRVHLKRRGRQFSRLLAAEECASALVMLDKPRSEGAWEYWLPTPFASFPFTSPSRASPCAIWFQTHSTTDTKCSEQALLPTRIARTFPIRLHHNTTQSRTKITLAFYCSMRVRGTVHYLRYILMPMTVNTFLQKSIRDYKQSLASDADFEESHIISIQHVSKLDTKWMIQPSRWLCHIHRLVTYEAQRHLGGATKDVHVSL